MEFNIGDEIFINYPVLVGHICIIKKITPSYVLLYHPTLNWQGYTTSFTDFYDYNPQKATKLHKAIL